MVDKLQVFYPSKMRMLFHIKGFVLYLLGYLKLRLQRMYVSEILDNFIVNTSQISHFLSQTVILFQSLDLIFRYNCEICSRHDFYL